MMQLSPVGHLISVLRKPRLRLESLRRIGLPALLATLGLVLIVACGKEKKLEKRVILHPNKAIWKLYHIQRTAQGDTLIQGPYKEFFWNGSPEASTQYIDGVKNGSAQAWYDNNGLKWTKVYDHGKRTETWRLYFKDGRTWVSLHFVADKIEDTVQVWDKVDPEKVQRAVFKANQCLTGDCALLDSLPVADSLPITEKNEIHKQSEILKSFLE